MNLRWTPFLLLVACGGSSDSASDTGTEGEALPACEDDPLSVELVATGGFLMGEIALAPNGDLLIAGSFQGSFTWDGDTRVAVDEQAIVTRLSADGEVLWTHHLGVDGWATVTGLDVLADGDVLIAGARSGEVDHVFVERLGEGGAVELSRTWDSPKRAWWPLGVASVDDAIFVAGSANDDCVWSSQTRPCKAFAERLGPDGQTAWHVDFEEDNYTGALVAASPESVGVLLTLMDGSTPSYRLAQLDADGALTGITAIEAGWGNDIDQHGPDTVGAIYWPPDGAAPRVTGGAVSSTLHAGAQTGDGYVALRGVAATGDGVVLTGEWGGETWLSRQPTTAAAADSVPLSSAGATGAWSGWVGTEGLVATVALSEDGTGLRVLRDAGNRLVTLVGHDRDDIEGLDLEVVRSCPTAIGSL